MASPGITVATAPNGRNLRNILAGLLVGYAIAAFYCVAAAAILRALGAPGAMMAALGMDLPTNVGADGRYITAVQTTALSVAIILSVPAFLLGMIISPRRGGRGGGRALVPFFQDRDDPGGVGWRALWVAVLATPFLLHFGGGALVAALNAAGVVLALG